MGNAYKKTTTRQRNNSLSQTARRAAQPSSTLSRTFNPAPLPIEIIGMIIEEYASQAAQPSSGKGGLARLARCSRALQVEAERRLYRNIKYYLGHPSAQEIAAVLRSRAARYVRYLHIKEYGPALRRGRSSAKNGVAALPFNLMVGLERLKISFDNDAAIGLPVNPELFLLLEKELPENILRRFSCRRHLHPSNLKFLDRQTNSIEHLMFRLLPSSGDVDHSNDRKPFTKLIELHTMEMDDVIFSFMERATIRLLAVKTSFHMPPNWSSVSMNLWVLDLAFCAIGPRTMQDLVVSSPGLRMLVFTVGHQWEELQVSVSISVLENQKLIRKGLQVNVFEILVKFKHLQYVGLKLAIPTDNLDPIVPPHWTFGKSLEAILMSKDECVAEVKKIRKQGYYTWEKTEGTPQEEDWILEHARSVLCYTA
ncbi:hypothetical protein SISNIDRAFT_547538 [Sistotremastrum niveocremeum HHB9708]|uniref:F-box domain-containing protein n=1 Tax=Sistotremastrum niveocremeum HHB9708 TaxID=1314777 RepID=A0A164YDK3_9AGAM|nr:hypothetical protein SISNIDRAFT_547538 [Sistotremastrum niveocremeum HHB9708]